MDPDCDSPDDPSEAADAVGPLAVLLEGVYDNGDGTFEAYFSYLNSTESDIAVAIGDASEAKNFFSPGVPSRGQPAVFKKGVFRGAFHFTFSGERLVWTVKPAGGREMQVEVSAQSPRLEPVEPVAECINQNKAGGFVATFGYLNRNEIDISIPIGKFNNFAPGKQDRSQPNLFFTGLNTSVVLAGFDTELSWQLPGKRSAVSPTTKVCECTGSNTQVSKDRVIKTSEELGLVLFTATDNFEKASLIRMGGASVAAKKRLKAAIARVKAKTAQSVVEVRDRVSSLPDVSRNCPQLPANCRQVDDGPTLQQLRIFYVQKQKQVMRTVGRSNFIAPSIAKRNKGLIKKAKVIVKAGLAELDKIPRFRLVCK